MSVKCFQCFRVQLGEAITCQELSVTFRPKNTACSIVKFYSSVNHPKGGRLANKSVTGGRGCGNCVPFWSFGRILASFSAVSAESTSNFPAFSTFNCNLHALRTNVNLPFWANNNKCINGAFCDL